MTNVLVRAVAGLLLSTTVALADPTGSYRVEGRNPGNDGGYSGTVQVARTGETYKVTWRVDGETFVGTGIGDGEFIAVSYRSGNETGLALFGRKGSGGWEGVWTYAGGTKMGLERWERGR